MKLIEHDGYLKAENYTIRTYTDEYYDYLYDKYEQNDTDNMNNIINSERMSLVNSWCKMRSILDYGCGTGSFIKFMDANGECYTYGYEIIPKTVPKIPRSGAMVIMVSRMFIYFDIRFTASWASASMALAIS